MTKGSKFGINFFSEEQTLGRGPKESFLDIYKLIAVTIVVNQVDSMSWK